MCILLGLFNKKRIVRLSKTLPSDILPAWCSQAESNISPLELSDSPKLRPDLPFYCFVTNNKQ